MHPVLPISLDCPADFEGLSGFRMCMDEVHNVYLYVGGTMVVPLVEMMPNRIFEIYCSYNFKKNTLIPPITNYCLSLCFLFSFDDFLH